ncbi:hypothetical protein GEV33_010222 [Tenebrio molitor]|uniref:Uncharacterized protein n=1 Tax=Tenebrio molitor TaxID=7067 RepID=A0A8J6HD98_TENMO|nr:hypothetical protein GEV33_010222 [Tenebrio molitor]
MLVFYADMVGSVSAAGTYWASLGGLTGPPDPLVAVVTMTLLWLWWQKVYTYHPRSHRGRRFAEIVWCTPRPDLPVVPPGLRSVVADFMGKSGGSEGGVGGLRSPTFELGEQTAPRTMACGRGRERGLRAGGSRQLPEVDERFGLDLLMVHERMTVPPGQGTDARCNIFLAFGQEENGGDCGLAPRSGIGKWQTTICLPLKRSGRLPNPTFGKPIGLADALPRERTLSGNVDTLEAHRCGLTLSGQRGRGFPPNSINLSLPTHFRSSGRAERTLFCVFVFQVPCVLGGYRETAFKAKLRQSSHRAAVCALCCAVCCASLCLVCLRVPTYVSQQGGYICSSDESCATSVLRYYSSALCARVRLRTPTQQGGDAQESGVSAVHVSRNSGTFQNVLEGFDATQRSGRAAIDSRNIPEGSAKQRTAMTEIAEKAGTSGQNPDEKREPVPTNWEEREAASTTTAEAMETGAPAAAAAEIGAKRARDEAEESGEEEAPTRTKVLIRGAEAEAETPKKTGEKSGDSRQLQPGQGWRIEAARRRIFTALKKITEATNRETTGKLTFRRDDQRQVREAQDEIQEAVSDMLMEVVLAREERVLQVRLQRMEATAGRDTRGPSQKKLDQLREDLAKEAGVEPPARKGAQPPTEEWETVGKKKVAKKTQGGPPKGAQQQGGPTEGAQSEGAPTKGAKPQVGAAKGAPTKGAQHRGAPTIGAQPQGGPTRGAQPQGGPTNGAQSQGGQKMTYAQRLKARVEEVHETVVAAESGCGLKNVLQQVDIKVIGGPVAQMSTRKDGNFARGRE